MEIILNDKIDVIISLNSKKVDIDGKNIKISSNKKYKCSFDSESKLVISYDKNQTLSKGTVKINGDISPNNQIFSGGSATIFNNTYKISNIIKHRNLFDPNIVDFTEVILI